MAHLSDRSNMAERVPTPDELRAFLSKQIAEARRMNEPDRVNDLLDKLADLDSTYAFIEQVLG